MTRLGKEIIPSKLVGENKGYWVLKDPTKPAYPDGDEPAYPDGFEGGYSDDYISRLNETYSIHDIFGKEIIDIAQKRGLERFIMDSPLNNSEGENILARMLTISAQAGEWQPFVVNVPQLTDSSIKTAGEYLERIQRANNFGKVNAGILFGLKVAINGGFALPTEYESRVIAVPSQSFVEYIVQRK